MNILQTCPSHREPAHPRLGWMQTTALPHRTPVTRISPLRTIAAGTPFIGSPGGLPHASATFCLTFSG